MLPRKSIQTDASDKQHKQEVRRPPADPVAHQRRQDRADDRADRQPDQRVLLGLGLDELGVGFGGLPASTSRLLRLVELRLR